MLVCPDKNMGSPFASESFKKVQNACEVLSDAVKKREYDEQLRKEESKCVLQRSASTSHWVHHSSFIISYGEFISVETSSGSTLQKKNLIVNLMQSCRAKETKTLV